MDEWMTEGPYERAVVSVTLAAGSCQTVRTRLFHSWQCIMPPDNQAIAKSKPAFLSVRLTDVTSAFLALAVMTPTSMTMAVMTQLWKEGPLAP